MAEMVWHGWVDEHYEGGITRLRGVEAGSILEEHMELPTTMLPTGCPVGAYVTVIADEAEVRTMKGLVDG